MSGLSSASVGLLTNWLGLMLRAQGLTTGNPASCCLLSHPKSTLLFALADATDCGWCGMLARILLARNPKHVAFLSPESAVRKPNKEFVWK